MSVLTNWNCPPTNDNLCYFEQNEGEILVVISKVNTEGYFTWLRIHHSTIPIQNTEELKWALYSPEEEDDYTFILFDKWTTVQSTSTVRHEDFNLGVEDSFNKIKKGLVESINTQTIRLRRLTKKYEQRQSLQFRY